MSIVNRSWHCHNEKIGGSEMRRLRGERHGCTFELGEGNFPRPIPASFEIANPVRVDVKTDDRHPRSAECYSHRQSDVPEANNRDIPHTTPFEFP